MRSPPPIPLPRVVERSDLLRWADAVLSKEDDVRGVWAEGRVEVDKIFHILAIAKDLEIVAVDQEVRFGHG